MSKIGQSSTTKLMQLNAENLFIYLDEELPADMQAINELEWQNFSKASVPNKPLNKIQALAESILDINPDIIGLNEVGGGESLENFNRIFLNDRFVPYLIEGNSDRGIDVGYLVSKNWIGDKKIELVSHKNRPIQFNYPHELLRNPKAPSLLFSRDCAELRVSTGSDEAKMILFLVHLKSKLDREGIDPFGNLRRKAEVSTLIQIYKEAKAKLPDAHFVVMGDLNGIARSDSCDPEFEEIYQSTDLKNALELADIEKEYATTQVQFTRQNGRELLQFDYIFLSENLQAKLIKEQTYVYRYKNDLGIYSSLPTNFDQKLLLPSDHYPVVVTMDLKGIF